jgi:hypothetical protein
MMNRHTRPIPILIDNSLNRAFAVKYALFSLFGLAGFLTDIPAITEMSGQAVASVVGFIVFVGAGLSSFAAWNSEKGIDWKKFEIYSTYFFMASVGIYSADMIWLAITGSEGRIALAFLSLALLVMPVWRLRFLIRRTRSNL